MDVTEIFCQIVAYNTSQFDKKNQLNLTNYFIEVILAALYCINKYGCVQVTDIDIGLL